MITLIVRITIASLIASMSDSELVSGFFRIERITVYFVITVVLGKSDRVHIIFMDWLRDRYRIHVML